jgi:hypothetical protein
MMTIWVWLAFIGGAWVHILYRANIKVKGPDQSITTYRAYFFFYGPVLLFRATIGGALYWMTFDPDLFANILRLMGWSTLSTIPALFPHTGVVALIAGLSIDSVLDFIAQKIPWFQNFLPPLTLTPNQEMRKS